MADANESITLELPRACKLDQFATFMSWGGKAALSSFLFYYYYYYFLWKKG